MKGLDLKPRAVAVLCALRNGHLTVARLRRAIGDQTDFDVRMLLNDMLAMSLVGGVGSDWYLDRDGVGWLQQNGLDAVESARLYVAREAVSP